jgi:hypothetical protein
MLGALIVALAILGATATAAVVQSGNLRITVPSSAAAS